MQADLQDPRPTLLSKIDIAACKVEQSDAPIVLLCGGCVPIKDHPSDPTPPLRSLRHAITQKTPTSFEIFRPEEITSWQSDGVFKNLMNFEKNLAHICSLVVIILESPGSLTELGAFSQLPDLTKKIIAIKSTKFSNDPSFINLGILRHLKESDPESVKTYPWDTNNPVLITQDIISDVVVDIQEALNKLTKSATFNLTDGSHIVVLICEIIELFCALKESEILDYLLTVGVTIRKEELKRILFLLLEFKLIKLNGYSDATFYIRCNEKHHRLRLALKDGANTDSTRIKLVCLEYYNKEPKQRKRVRALAQIPNGGSK